MAVNIGKIKLTMPFFQAAIAGYSDFVMRSLARRFGAPLTFGGVMIDTSAAHPVVRRKLGFIPREGEHPLGGQIVGTDPASMAIAAKALAEVGYDIIDLNFACPAPKVLRRGRGGSMMNDPNTVIEIYRRVRETVSCPVTMKLRIGYDETDASSEDFWKIVETAAAEKIDALIIHGRTVTQHYRGRADYSRIYEVKKRFPHIPVFGSGDIFSAEAVMERINAGLDGVSVARGAIGNPWIFREACAIIEGKAKPASPSIAEQKEIITWHFENIQILHGKQKAIGYFRKFSAQYAKFHPEKKLVHHDLVGAPNAQTLLAAIKNWYS
ncbi:MAG: hypothetical protein A2Y07_00070 [Planctomycetes bacterium GWF2_50_10]|nr:MAG: hypothetical protein A2Y07_00070 [Planctomycetes bacterium GWF2_50_10]